MGLCHSCCTDDMFNHHSNHGHSSRHERYNEPCNSECNPCDPYNYYYPSSQYKQEYYNPPPFNPNTK